MSGVTSARGDLRTRESDPKSSRTDRASRLRFEGEDASRSGATGGMCPMSTMNGNPTTNRSAPDLLTVEEAARVLRIGRTKAYELARLYLVSDGAEGAGRSPLASAALRARGADRWSDHVADPQRRT